MATRPARFEFHCEKAPGKLKYVHQIPSSLIRADAQGQTDPAYINEFVRALRPIMTEHEKECQNKASSICENCGKPP